MSLGILEDVDSLDFTNPFDELRELREVLTAAQIAELTGLRRETISRARPDSRFRRSTEKAIGDLYTVVTRLRSADAGDPGQIEAVLRRPQAVLDGRSIACLLRQGGVAAVLAHLPLPVPSSEVEELEDFRLTPKVEAELRALEKETADQSGSDSSNEKRVADLLAVDRELARSLAKIEGLAREVFGATVDLKREAVTGDPDFEGVDCLYLRVLSGLPFDDELDLLTEFFDRADDLLAPIEDRLTVGNL